MDHSGLAIRANMQGYCAGIVWGRALQGYSAGCFFVFVFVFVSVDFLRDCLRDCLKDFLRDVLRDSLRILCDIPMAMTCYDMLSGSDDSNTTQHLQEVLKPSFRDSSWLCLSSRRIRIQLNISKNHWKTRKSPLIFPN